MSLEHLAGTTYGPFPVRVTAEQVAAYVAATGDDPNRWVHHAPPSFAGALLFAAAPAFLESEEVKPHTRLLVHADQSFTWHRAVAIDERVSVAGTVSRVRSRGGATFVTFEAAVRAGAEAVVDARSTFLLGAGEPDDAAAEEEEPPVTARRVFAAAPVAPDLREGPVPELARSASRLDLVKYAAASGDFNPIHFDHETARRAGFPGVLVHGLLMGAWLVQVASTYSSLPDGVASVRLRFRNPLRPAAQAKVTGEIEEVSDDGARLRLVLRGQESDYVEAQIGLRTA